MDFVSLEQSSKCRSKWMQCDACGKFRRLPRRATTLDPVTGQERVDAGYLAQYTVDVWARNTEAKTVDDIMNAGGWVCAMNPWDPLHNSCEAPQDVELSTSYYFDTYVDYPDDLTNDEAASNDETESPGRSSNSRGRQRQVNRDKLISDPGLFRQTLDGFLQNRGLGGYPTKLALGGKPLSLHALFIRVIRMGGFAAMNRVRGTWSKIFHELDNYSETMTSASNSLKNTYQKYLSEFERSFGALDLTKAGSRGTSVIPSWHAHHECLACTERIHSTHLVPAADTPTAVKCRYCSGRYHLRCLLTPLARTQMKSWACEPCISSHRAPSSSDTAAHNEGSNVANSAGEDEGHDDGGTRKKARLDHSKDPTSVASSAVLVEAVSNEVLSVCFL